MAPPTGMTPIVCSSLGYGLDSVFSFGQKKNGDGHTRSISSCVCLGSSLFWGCVPFADEAMATAGLRHHGCDWSYVVLPIVDFGIRDFGAGPHGCVL